MRRSINILPAVVVLAVLPFMLGAVVLSDPNAPSSHGPVLEMPNGPLLLDPGPEVLEQPIHPTSGPMHNSEAAGPELGSSSDSNQKPAQTKAAAVKPLEGEKSSIVITDKKDAAKASPKTEKNAPAAVEPVLPPLSPEMEALRDRVRQTISNYKRPLLNSNDNTAANILQACMAFGCDAEIRQGGGNGSAVNGFTYLCWNYPCNGYNLLTISQGHIAARLGYGVQSNPSEFLAIMALARVPNNYPIRVGETVRTVADLVESEKLSCRADRDLSYKIIGLSRYLPAGATWKNDIGEEWSVSRLLKEELNNAQKPSPCGGTHRLLAISYAVDRQIKQNLPLEGQFIRAKKYVVQYQDYALALQNPDGSWHPEFFKYRGSGGSVVDQINSTGHIMAWLASSLPDDKLQDARVVSSVNLLTELLSNRRLNNLASTSDRDITARMQALHALSVYDQRVFAPYDSAIENTEGPAPAAPASVEKVSRRSTVNDR